MSLGEYGVHEVQFNLRRACNNCPFRKSTPHHEGVASDLSNLWGQIEKGGFLHSCHKTDPRSDGYVPGYKGPVSHCAGSLMMLKNMGPEYLQGSMLLRHVRRYMEKLKPDPDIFPSFLAMVEHYLPFIRTRVPDSTLISDQEKR
jgi:hypothetical protein